MPTIKTTLMRLFGVAFALLATTASAVPCAGFNDVDSTSQFCANVEWMKNRGVTAGCATSLYCPNDAVNRLAMAAFMNRLGSALTPVQLRVDATPGAIDLDLNGVACASGPFAVTGFPRRAIVDGHVNATAPAALDFAGDPVFSLDGGTVWTALSAGPNFGYVEANRWISISQIGHLDLEVGQSVRFGIRIARMGGSGTVDLSDSRCQLRVLIFSRDGLASPF